MLTVIILSLLVLLHELGHFLIAKLFGIHVLEFGIGLPPKALKLFKYKETEYTLNWLPIGGFVRLAGEDPTSLQLIGATLGAGRHLFFTRPAWQRALVVLAGVGMNLVIAMAMFGVVYTKLGIPKLVGEQVMVSSVAEGSPGDLAEIAAGDILVRVGDTEVANSEQFVELVKNKGGQSVSLYIATTDSSGRRSDSARVVELIPRVNPPEGEGAIGIAVATVPIVTYEKKVWYQAPFYAMVEGTKETVAWSREFWRILSHPRELLSNLSGPVAVVRVGQQAVSDGWVSTMRFGGIISLNLAIFNLLPIPALDGGRLVMIGLEKIVGRKRVAKYEGYVNGVGMFLLIALLIGVTVKDIWFR